MDNSKLTSEAKKLQFLAGILNESQEEKTSEILKENLDGAEPAAPELTPQINPEIQVIVDRLNEILNGSTFKLNVKPDRVNLRFGYWKKLPLGILGQLKYEFDVYQDDDLGDEEMSRTEYTIKPKF